LTLRSYTESLFTIVINIETLKAGAIVTASDFHPSLIFVGKVGAYPSGCLRIGSKPYLKSRVELIGRDKHNAYNTTALIPIVNSIIVHAPLES
jgi:hypothetical protein